MIKDYACEKCGRRMTHEQLVRADLRCPSCLGTKFLKDNPKPYRDPRRRAGPIANRETMPS